jgi:fructokinase
MKQEPKAAKLRIGIDLGGSKIAGLALGSGGEILAEHRMPAPRHDYEATIKAIGEMLHRLDHSPGRQGSIGIGMPGSISPSSGLVQNANSTWLNGKPFARDLESYLQRPVRLANDANCFALSEAIDGAGAGARSVFGVIIGTGCGGGLVLDGVVVNGPRGIGGEWGHNPLPWPEPAEYPGPRCWCGRQGCMEAWVSGPALESDHARHTGEQLATEQVAARAAAGSREAQASLDRHASRLARGLAHVVNIFDPEAVVLGGGLSQLDHLYQVLPRLVAPHVFADCGQVVIKPPRWGDASGVRGAAWLWGRP